MYSDLVLHSWTFIYTLKNPWRAFAEAAAGGGTPPEWTLPENDPRTHIPPADAAGSLWREGEAPKEKENEVFSRVESIFSEKVLKSEACEVIGSYTSCAGRTIYLLRSTPSMSHYVLVARWENKPRLGASEENLNRFLNNNGTAMFTRTSVFTHRYSIQYRVVSDSPCGRFV